MKYFRPQVCSRDQRGLTLVEMVVVFTIIALLSVIGLRMYDGFRQASRDTERATALYEIVKGLEQFKNDFGHYPVAGGRNTAPFVYGPADCSTSDWDGDTGGIGNGLRFDNSSSGMVTELWTRGYTNANLFTDPLNPWGVIDNSRYNCRYIIPMTSQNEVDGTPPGNYDESNPCTRYPRCCPDNGPDPDPEFGGCNKTGPYIVPVPCNSYECAASDVALSNRYPHPDTYRDIQKYYLHCTLERPNDRSTGDKGSPTAAGNELLELYWPDRWLCVQDITSSI